MNNLTLQSMRNWLIKLEAACKRRMVATILNLYDENQERSDWRWSDAPQEMQDKYERLVTRANNIIY